MNIDKINNICIELQTEWLGYESGCLLVIGRQYGSTLIGRGTAKEIPLEEYMERKAVNPAKENAAPKFDDEIIADKSSDSPPNNKEIRKPRNKK